MKVQPRAQVHSALQIAIVKMLVRLGNSHVPASGYLVIGVRTTWIESVSYSKFTWRLGPGQRNVMI